MRLASNCQPRITPSVARLAGLLWLLLASPLPAEERIAYLGWLEPEQHGQAHIEAGIMLAISDHAFFAASLARQDDSPSRRESTQLGFMLFTGNRARLYAGVGLYGSRTRNCSNNIDQDCDDHYDAGLYPEAGVMLGMGRLYIGAYARHYHHLVTDDSDEQAVGGFLGVTF